MHATSKVSRIMTLLVIAVVLIPGASAMQPQPPPPGPQPLALMERGKAPPPSGVFEFNDVTFGGGLTECPQAGIGDNVPRPLDLRERDQVEEISDDGDDRRTNQDYSCFPQNETSIAINPRNPRNLVGGANDYRLGFGTSGVYASTDGGDHWYDAIIPFPTLPNGDVLDGGGDPAVAFDRDGVAYYAEINFNRTDDTNGMFVSRSTNGGFTWSRMCVPIDTTPEDTTDNAGVCGGLGDPRQPGDGVITFLSDDNTVADSSIPFNDKEYIAIGPRPAGVDPVCFAPFTRTPVECNPAVVGADRIYVGWALFGTFRSVETANIRIMLSYSDDQARSWSPPRPINGSAPFCVGALDASNECSFSSGTVPTVNPTTGHLYVAFENFNTPDENQYLVVRSRDGGQTFEGPFFVTPVFDRNYPLVPDVNDQGEFVEGNRPDCYARDQQPFRDVLTNSCFRVNPWGNVVADKRGGAFADDLYLVMSDNRNGTPGSSNTDTFFFKSTDGGSSWIGPTRVNNDPSQLTGDRNDPANTNVTGSDQWFPWVDINERGNLNVVFHDRRLDTNSTASEWPESRQRPGNYLAWFFGAQCTVSSADSRQCVASEAEVIPQPTEPIDPGSGPQPGQNQSRFPFANFQISDVPSNMDYSFRAGLFMGDYNNVATMGNVAYGFWTDARNGRSSRDQEGRNPACEQSDVFIASYAANLYERDETGSEGGQAEPTDELFLVTPCAEQANGNVNPFRERERPEDITPTRIQTFLPFLSLRR